MMKKVFLFSIALVLISSPIFSVHAKITPDCGVITSKPVLDKDGNPTLDSKGNPVTIKTMAQPCGINEVMKLISNIIHFLLIDIAAPLAGLIIAYAGFQLLTSGGNPEKKTSAKNILMNVIIGYVVALSAWIIIHSIFSWLKIDGCRDWLNKDIPDCEVKSS